MRYGLALYLSVHLLDEAEGGVSHEQGEDNPEVEVRPEAEGEQTGDLNLRARVSLLGCGRERRRKITLLCGSLLFG